MSKHDHRETIGRALCDAADPCSLAQPLPVAAPDSVGARLVGAGGSAPATAAAPPEGGRTPYIDANGFDPAAYDWMPVRRRPRTDGFSEAKQRLFIETLADTGSVETAAQTIGLSVQSCYRLRRAPGAEAFAAAWNAAIQQAALKLVDIAFERAIHGSDEPVFDRAGRRVGRRLKPSDRMLMFLMRAHLPERYRHAHQSVRQLDEPPAPAAPPLAEAIATLEPATPPDPHRLMPPEALDVALEVADMCEGTLPPWHRPEAVAYASEAEAQEEPDPLVLALDRALARAAERDLEEAGDGAAK